MKSHAIRSRRNAMQEREKGSFPSPSLPPPSFPSPIPPPSLPLLCALLFSSPLLPLIPCQLDEQQRIFVLRGESPSEGEARRDGSRDGGLEVSEEQELVDS
eukprot:761230-Hanusia_phi.AAC.8